MKWMITTLTCTLLIAFGYGIYSILVKTAPKAEIKRPEKQALLIETEKILNENTQDSFKSYAQILIKVVRLDFQS